MSTTEEPSVEVEEHSVQVEHREEPLNLSVWTQRILVRRHDPYIAEYVSCFAQALCRMLSCLAVHVQPFFWCML